MNEINDGGPAFPRPYSIEYDQYGHREEVHPATEGMTLRDYFAIKAMHAMYVTSCDWEQTGLPRDEENELLLLEMATDAYGIADAMLKARQK